MNDLAVIESNVERSRLALADVLTSIREMASLADLRETRARIEALRAWAKIHKQISAIRIDLLHAEVAALVRIVRLGGVDDLPTPDQKAAEYLAGLDDDARAALILQSAAQVTTAAGLVRTLWLAEDRERNRRDLTAKGRQHATQPQPLSDEAIKDADNRITDVAATLKRLLDEYTVVGQPFTVPALAAEIMARAGLTSGLDDALAEGVREVCRTAIRSAPSMHVNGTEIPRLVTTRLPDGSYVRVPVENATLAHFDDMCSLRREQLAQDAAALARLDEVARKLHSIKGARAGSRIGDLIARLSSRRRDAA